MRLKIMSFNLRYDTEGDGINRFSIRLPRVLDTIRKENPDIIGFQEVTDPMREIMRKNLTDYITVGCGRDKNYHGEAMLIAYRTSLFEMISCENIWLSETPNVAGSHYGGDHSHCPRMYTSLLLKADGIEAPFRFINTHLDHVSAQGRVLEATQLTAAINKYDEKFILTGDFNATPDAPEIALICSNLAHRGGRDCTAELGPTFHNFGRYTPEEMVKIDYIFTDGVCENAYRVEDTPINGQYYSDHNAVCAYIEL